MKRFIYASIGIFILLGIGSYFAFSQKSSNELNSDHSFKNVNSTGVMDDKEKKSCCSHNMDSEKISENSVYQLESVWKNESNKEIKLSDFKGKNVVIAMIFANCTYACPIIINDMKRIESELSNKELKNTKFILVSIDPERDTPEVLYDLSKRQNLDQKRWTLLTGTQDDVRELAAVFGFKYQKDEKGDYSHSNLINILNDDGEIVYQYEGLNKGISEAVTQVSMLN